MRTAPMVGERPAPRRTAVATVRAGAPATTVVDSGRYGGLRATVGQLRTHPGLPSVIPDRAELTVDLRNPDDAAMTAAEHDLAAFLDTLGLRVETVRMAKTAAVAFDDDVQKLIATTADDLGLPTMALMSGAGHDAQEMAAVTPTAMIFVRGQCQGISHSPREYSTPEDCAAGVRVLAATVLRLAER